MLDTSSKLFFETNSAFGLVVLTMNLIVNCWILFLIFNHRTSRTIPNILISNLSFAAIFYSILAFIACFYNLRSDWAYGQNGYVVRAFLLVLTLTAVCYSFLIQALSRLFFAIYYHHRFLLRWKIHWAMIVSVWIFSFLISLVPLRIHDGLIFERQSRICTVSSENLPITSFCILIVYFIPLTIVFLVYVCILIHVRRSAQRIYPNVIQRQTFCHEKRELSIIRRLVLQIASFFSGGILYLFNIIWQKLNSNPLPRPMFLLSLNFITLSLFASSLIQLFINKCLRDKTRRYFQRLKCC